jgi:hypothetical protein
MIQRKGVDYECTAPAFVDEGVALAAAHGLTRRILQRRSFPTGSSSWTAAPPERRSSPPRPTFESQARLVLEVASLDRGEPLSALDCMALEADNVAMVCSTRLHSVVLCGLVT